jgi:hypothetical protein
MDAIEVNPVFFNVATTHLPLSIPSSQHAFIKATYVEVEQDHSNHNHLIRSCFFRDIHLLIGQADCLQLEPNHRRRISQGPSSVQMNGCCQKRCMEECRVMQGEWEPC